MRKIPQTFDGWIECILRKLLSLKFVQITSHVVLSSSILILFLEVIC